MVVREKVRHIKTIINEMHNVLHFLGLCPDAHSHLDLIDILIGAGSLGGVSAFIVYLKFRWKYLKFQIRSLFKSNKDATANSDSDQSTD